MDHGRRQRHRFGGMVGAGDDGRDAVANVHTIKPLDVDSVGAFARGAGAVVTAAFDEMRVLP